ncbi:hypothetical protein A1OE_7 [Candidatus Endolissoclinum faulkneri L2]|uniref:Uncharacterized protein n=1 Tax=Candidatus Endolissoclinum faulkneri L2 TaxID=1193729 RepID=K7YL64_9PROT|nr:hypothetical protein A1OE_7 [Candidatus Endolissoclinum faulkneri L2]
MRLLYTRYMLLVVKKKTINTHVKVIKKNKHTILYLYFDNFQS